MASNSIKFHIERRLSVLFGLGPYRSYSKINCLESVHDFRISRKRVICSEHVRGILASFGQSCFQIKFIIIVIIEFNYMILQKIGMSAAILPSIGSFIFLFVIGGRANYLYSIQKINILNYVRPTCVKLWVLIKTNKINAWNICSYFVETYVLCLLQ